MLRRPVTRRCRAARVRVRAARGRGRVQLLSAGLEVDAGRGADPHARLPALAKRARRIEASLPVGHAGRGGLDIKIIPGMPAPPAPAPPIPAPPIPAPLYPGAAHPGARARLRARHHGVVAPPDRLRRLAGGADLEGHARLVRGTHLAEAGLVELDREGQRAVGNESDLAARGDAVTLVAVRRVADAEDHLNLERRAVVARRRDDDRSDLPAAALGRGRLGRQRLGVAGGADRDRRQGMARARHVRRQLDGHLGGRQAARKERDADEPQKGRSDHLSSR